MINMLVALTPLALAFTLLTVFRQNSRIVGLVTLGSTIFLVTFFPAFHLSLAHVVLSLGTSLVHALPLLTILFPAIVLYQVQRLGGAMTVLIKGILRITADQDHLVLLLVFGFAPFLDAICGMNVGIFVIAPILLSLRISPLRVACLSMLSQVTSIWGTMGLATLLISNATGIPGTIIGSDSAILLMPATLCLCATALLLSGRNMKETLRAWIPIVGTAVILTAGAWLVIRLTGIELAGMLTDMITITFLALLGRLQTTRPIAQRKISRRKGVAPFTAWQLWKAALPYAILTIFLFLSHVILPLENWLQSHVVLSLPQIGLMLPLLYLPGSWLVVMACLAIFLARMHINAACQALSIAWKQFAPSALAIISFFATAYIMQESGMIATFGGVATTLGTEYVWISPWLGAISGWATGSAISANSLFAALQKSVALRTGLPVAWIVAAQNTTGSLGKILSPTSAILAGSAAGISGQEGLMLRKIGFPILLALILITIVLGFTTGHFAGAVALAILVASLLILRIVCKLESNTHTALHRAKQKSETGKGQTNGLKRMSIERTHLSSALETSRKSNTPNTKRLRTAKTRGAAPLRTRHASSRHP